MGEEQKEAGKKKKPRLKKILLIVLAALAAVFIILLAAGYFVFYSLFDKSNYVAKNKEDAAQQETYLDADGVAHQYTGVYNVLLIGVDRTDDSWQGNSDVMMLVSINHDTKKIVMTSFLRDLYADIPGIGVQKLNASCANGGPTLCVQTISQNYQIQIDNYAMVDFNAMIEIVDALGGIELEIDEYERLIANDYVYCMCEENGETYEDHIIEQSGLVQLDGYQAVGYARNRYSGGTSDFGRTERQRKVLIAIFEKAKAGGLGSLTEAAASVLPYVTHDIDQITLLSLIPQLPEMLTYEIVQQHIPFDGEYTSEGEILIPTDMEATIQKMKETIYN